MAEEALSLVVADGASRRVGAHAGLFSVELETVEAMPVAGAGMIPHRHLWQHRHHHLKMYSGKHVWDGGHVNKMVHGEEEEEEEEEEGVRAAAAPPPPPHHGGGWGWCYRCGKNGRSQSC